jgi:hypothetical protein
LLRNAIRASTAEFVVSNDWVANTVTRDKIMNDIWTEVFQKASMLSWHAASHFLLQRVIKMVFGLDNGDFNRVDMAYLDETTRLGDDPYF